MARFWALLWSSRTTDSPGAANSAKFLIRLTPRPAACALSNGSADNVAQRGGESRIRVMAWSRAGLCALIPVALLVAADPLWKTKPPAQWTEDDAKQVLAASPWSMEIVAGVAARETEDQRREGGNMGQPHGVGYDNVDPKGSGPKLPPNIFTPTNQRSPRSLPGTMRLRLRWESALPVQLAELKAHEIDPPTLEGEGYRIAVYGLPSGDFKGDPKKLGDPLKTEAFLRREGKPDVKPLRVEVFQRDDGAAVVYLFPFSAEITEKNGQVEFNAQIGRIVVNQIFTLAQMEFQGKLEL